MDQLNSNSQYIESQEAFQVLLPQKNIDSSSEIAQDNILLDKKLYVQDESSFQVVKRMETPEILLPTYDSKIIILHEEPKLNDLPEMQEKIQNSNSSTEEQSSDINQSKDQSEGSNNYDKQEMSQGDGVMKEQIIENNSEDEEQKVEDSSPVFPNMVSLPSWLLDCEKALDKFKTTYDHFKKEHGILSEGIKKFNEKQQKERQDYLLRKLHIQQKDIDKMKNRAANFDLLPKYLYITIAKFISVDYPIMLMKLMKVNSTIFHKLKDGNIWCAMVHDYLGAEFVNQNKKFAKGYENEHSKAMQRLLTQKEKQKQMEKQIKVPFFRYQQQHRNIETTHPPGKPIHIEQESYWEVIFKDFYQRLLLMKETFQILYDSKFPKNNQFNLLNKDINLSLNFIIEVISTIGTFQYGEKLRIVEKIKEIVMHERSILGILRLCNSENGVIRINSFTVLFIFVGYFPELKPNFLKFATVSAIKQIEDSRKEDNIKIFSINMSQSPVFMIPDITGFKIFNRKLFSKHLKTKGEITFTNTLPEKFPISENTQKWDVVFLTSRAEIIEEGELNIRFNPQTNELTGGLTVIRLIDEDEYESVFYQVRGRYKPQIFEQRIQAMKIDNSLKTFRDVVAELTVVMSRECDNEEYFLQYDFGISKDNKGWYGCLHGIFMEEKIMFSYIKLKE